MSKGTTVDNCGLTLNIPGTGYCTSGPTLWESMMAEIEYVLGVMFGACCTCGGIFAYCKRKAQKKAEAALQDPHKWLTAKREKAKLLQELGIEMKEIQSRQSSQIKSLKTNHATKLADLERQFKGASDKKYDEIMKRVEQLKNEHADKLKEVYQEQRTENIEFMKENAEKEKELAGIAGSIGVPGIEMGEMTSVVLGAGTTLASMDAAIAVLEIVEEAPVYISQAEFEEQEKRRNRQEERHRRQEESRQEWKFKIEVKSIFVFPTLFTKHIPLGILTFFFPPPPPPSHMLIRGFAPCLPGTCLTEKD